MDAKQRAHDLAILHMNTLQAQGKLIHISTSQEASYELYKMYRKAYLSYLLYVTDEPMLETGIED